MRSHHVMPSSTDLPDYVQAGQPGRATAGYCTWPLRGSPARAAHPAPCTGSVAGCAGSADAKSPDCCPGLPHCVQRGKPGGAPALDEQLASAPDHCGAALRMPRVAMLFLTRGPMPHEALWTAWLAGARGHIQAECAAVTMCSAEDPGNLKVPTAVLSHDCLLCPRKCMQEMGPASPISCCSPRQLLLQHSFQAACMAPLLSAQNPGG